MQDPLRNGNIAAQLFEELRRQILSGELSPGDRLPGERELAQQHGTNRNTLREAVRMLEQARLVSVRHGSGVTVCDFRSTGTMELFSAFLKAGPPMSEVADLFEDVLEPRVMLLEYISKLAARRAQPADLQRLRELGDLVIAAFKTGDAPVVARGFQRWLDALVEATHSVTVRWMANSIFEEIRDTLQRFSNLWVLEPTFPEHLRSLVAALEERDEQAAVRCTRDYYERVDFKLKGLLAALRGDDLPRSAGA